MDIKKYNIIFTDIAKENLDEIYYYINENLKEPSTAEKLITLIENEINRLSYYPYSCRKIHIKPRNELYRRLVIKNYIVLYRVIEEKKEVVIFYIIYAGKNYLSDNF